jgi:cell division protein FtsI (penicillin-binding protein 3)/stage V sporulation protein D (sporulation-specific penicillin-binding protein)
MEKKANRNWRIKLILGVIVICGAAIICRLFYLQVVTHKYWQSLDLGQQAGSGGNEIGSRGEIYCDNSQAAKGAKSSGEFKSLAINKEEWVISAQVSEIGDKEFFAKTLSDVTGATKEDVLEKLNSSNSYVVIAKGISKEKLDELKKLNLAGLKWEGSSKRYYPQGEFAADVIGFLGGEGTGQYGAEGYYEDELKGSFGIKASGGLGMLFSVGQEESLDGSDIYLTIDYNIQYEAESLLKQAKEKFDIDSGQIIVIRPDTGRVLAMAGYPSFNPNNYSLVQDMDIFQNASLQKLFEPGSIMKPFTMAIALNEGKITPETTYVDTGEVTISTETVHNFDNKVYGSQTMTQVLENSINTGAVFASQQVSRKTFLSYLKKFGFTEKTGMGLQGEVYSRNDNVMADSAPDINIATASFGQGIEITPIQMVRAFCSLANGGKMVRPYITEKIVTGTNEAYTQPEFSGQIISKDSLEKLTSMMVNVVDNGFNQVAKIPGYYIAGKTGTAQVAKENGKGYDEDKTIQSFIGFGPAYNPQFLVLVKLDNPKVSKSSLSAVPIFKQLAQYIINYWQIPPDYQSD